MNYWMFTVMYDDFPSSWKAMVDAGVAAQHYPEGWTNEKRNITALSQMKRGDALVAAFRGHRFAGYGSLTSDFYRDKGLPLHIMRYGEEYAFQERVKIDWKCIPCEKEKPFVRCHGGRFHLLFRDRDALWDKMIAVMDKDAVAFRRAMCYTTL